MEITVQGDTNKSIHIPDDLLSNINNTYRNQTTSYLNEFNVVNGKVNFNSDFLHRLVCYYNLWTRIKGTYGSSLDIFGGVGITAKMFQSSESNAYVNDLDPVCLRILRRNFPQNNVFSFDVTKPPYLRGNYDLILADFNDFTIKKEKEVYHEAVKEIFSIAKKYVVINDCSCFYLRYGKDSFRYYSRILGQEVNNLPEFYRAQKNYFQEQHPGWSLVNVEYFNNSSFLLFEKKITDDLLINRAIKQEIINIKYANVPTNGLLWDR